MSLMFENCATAAMAPFATLVEWLSAIKASGPLCALTLGHVASAIW